MNLGGEKNSGGGIAKIYPSTNQKSKFNAAPKHVVHIIWYLRLTQTREDVDTSK